VIGRGFSYGLLRATLRDAGNFTAKLPKRDHDAPP
jgi:hypothetical protein